VEIIAALVILSVLMGMIYTCLSTILTTNEALSQQVRLRAAGTTLLSVLGADLRAFFFYNYDFAYFAGCNEDGEGRPGSYVSFSTLNYNLGEEATSYDLVGKVTYRLAEDGAFLRTFEPVADYEGAPETSEQLLYTGVVSFAVQFLDGGEWLDEWSYDPENFTSPESIAIQLALVPEDEPEAEPTVFRAAMRPTTYVLPGEEDRTRPILRRRRRTGRPGREPTTGGRPTRPGSPTTPDDRSGRTPGNVPQPPRWPEGMPR